MTISLDKSRFEALVTLDVAGEVHACLAYTRGIYAARLIALFAIVQARMRVHCE